MMDDQDRRIPQRTLVVEDLPAAAEQLQALLQQAFPGVEHTLAENIAQARDMFGRFLPDLALVDLGLPDGSGIDLIAEFSAQRPECRCVVTTLYSDDEHLFSALRAGAQGYLLKDQPPARIVQALRGIADGEPPLSPSIAQRILKTFGATTGSIASVHTPSAAQLTPREREALTFAAKGYRLKELAETLGVTTNTAAGYLKSVYRKLRVDNRASATVEAVRMGLIEPR